MFEALVAADGCPRGCSSMVELKPSKLMTRVRFPSPAPLLFNYRWCLKTRLNKLKVGPCSSVVEHSLGKGEVTCSIHVKGIKFFLQMFVLIFSKHR